MTKDQIENELGLRLSPRRARPSKAEAFSAGMVEVTWSEEPLDVSLEKHGNKKPDRKVKVRGILRDAWLEKEAGLEAGRSRGRVFRVG